MKIVSKPDITASEVFLTCISKVRDAALHAKLKACNHLISQAETEFNSKIATGEIHSISKESCVNENIYAEDLQKVYTQRMAKKGVPGRVIYDKLISAPKLGICPLCSHRLVETLDHYLPKADFPRLAVTPINLVPSCSTCNKGKLASSPNKAEEETLHPYFDNIENKDWLFAEVNMTNPPTISYFVNPPVEWPDLLKERVKYHFEVFSLNKLYSTQAAVLIGSLNHRLDTIHKNSGIDGVKKYLADEYESRYVNDKNSLETAFYRATSKDDWFCDGGYQIT